MKQMVFNRWRALALLVLLLTSRQALVAQQGPGLMKQIMGMNGLVALWDFKEPAGFPRKALGATPFALQEAHGSLPRIDDGPLSGYSAMFSDSGYLRLPHDQTGALNIHGKNAQVSVVAWVKWTGGTGFVGGMWNEFVGGGRRQYGLFVSLPYYNGADQVCGHISTTGKPTPPFPYSIEYSASRSLVKKGQWQCVAFTYDGDSIRSYLNGRFERREPELINHTKGFTGSPDGLVQAKNPYFFPSGMGNNGSDSP